MGVSLWFVAVIPYGVYIDIISSGAAQILMILMAAKRVPLPWETRSVRAVQEQYEATPAAEQLRDRAQPTALAAITMLSLSEWNLPALFVFYAMHAVAYSNIDAVLDEDKLAYEETREHQDLLVHDIVPPLLQRTRSEHSRTIEKANDLPIIPSHKLYTFRPPILPWLALAGVVSMCPQVLSTGLLVLLILAAVTPHNSSFYPYIPSVIVVVASCYVPRVIKVAIVAALGVQVALRISASNDGTQFYVLYPRWSPDLTRSFSMFSRTHFRAGFANNAGEQLKAFCQNADSTRSRQVGAVVLAVLAVLQAFLFGATYFPWFIPMPIGRMFAHLWFYITITKLSVFGVFAVLQFVMYSWARPCFALKRLLIRRFRRSHSQAPQIAGVIRRNNIALDSFERLLQVDANGWNKHIAEQSPANANPRRLNITFMSNGVHEAGIDAGGVTRSWCVEFGQALCHPSIGAFEHVGGDDPLYTISKNVVYKDWYSEDNMHAIGRYLGIALFTGNTTGLQLSPAIYKALVCREHELSFADFLYHDRAMARNYLHLLPMSADELKEMDLTFVCDFSGPEAALGAQTIELCPNGANIAITRENVTEYVHAICKYKCVTIISHHINHIRQGMWDVVPRNLICCFSGDELRLALEGESSEVLTLDLLDHTTYVDAPMGAQQPLIRWFWNVVEDMTDAERCKLLKFATGSNTLPAGGAAELNPRFTLRLCQEADVLGRFPVAHTCFNRIDLYGGCDTEAALREKLMYSIEHSVAFGVA
jgi:HECT-domain (ubiquitin-transferase)